MIHSVDIHTYFIFLKHLILRDKRKFGLNSFPIRKHQPGLIDRVFIFVFLAIGAPVSNVLCFLEKFTCKIKGYDNND